MGRRLARASSASTSSTASPGHELKACGRKLVGTYLRVGLLGVAGAGGRSSSARTSPPPRRCRPRTTSPRRSSCRPTGSATIRPGTTAASYKFAVNCEYRLFQRPDDAIHRGLDQQTEADLARPDNFLSNFEPLTAEQARELVDRVTEFDEFTAADAAAARGPPPRRAPATSSARPIPRLVDGKPSKNPRYLQIRPDLLDPMSRYVAERGMRLSRGDPGRPARCRSRSTRCWSAGATTRPTPRPASAPLAVYNPIHYQELPELFMDFICSLTGKSPSTTGAGCEGALTKGPFNALRPIVDLNAALVSLHPHRPGAASPRPPATSARRCRSITTSACWSRRSGAG